MEGVIIGHSFGGKSLGRQGKTGSIRVQRIEPAGVKAVMQSEKGLQEIFIRTDGAEAERIARRVKVLMLPSR